jgi:peptide/nickel transport system permease protein
MILIFTVKLGWLPGGGMTTLGGPSSLSDRILHLIMPVSAAALYNAGIYSRYLRSSLLEVINLDYIRTARAKGLRERIVFSRHALRNALIPLVTIVALDLPWMFGGAVLTETIFSWPGMGRQFWKASLDQDYPVILSMVMLVAVAVVVFNLLADVLYAYLDPRIRYE